jgi:hypothetical protein
MSFRTPFRYLLVLAALLVFAGSAAAQADLGPQRNATSSSSQLNLTATAQTALQLDISTASGGATVVGNTGNSSTGVFSLDFGNVNGLGLGTPSTGVTVAVQAGGALYTSPVSLTPRYSGFSTSSASVSVLLDGTAGNAAGRTATREGAAAASVVAPSTTVPNIFTSAASNGTAITRYVGVFVSNVNGAGAVNGALSSRLIYQITVP